MAHLSRLNVLAVVFDSLSACDLNHHLDRLPTFRALMGDSHNFTNAYASCPEGSPARASLFTGLDMAAHGVWTDGVGLPKHNTLLPQMFGMQGYQSWLVGRRHLAGVAKWTTEHARFDEFHRFDWAHGPLHRSRQNAYLMWLEHTAPDLYAEVFPRQADADDTHIPPAQRAAMAAVPDHLSFHAWVGDRVSQHMERAPFFGVAGFVVGHTMGAGGATTEAVDLKALMQADAALAKILNVMPDPTAVVVTAARGSVNDPAAGAMQDRAIKVPLLIRTPTREARQVSEIVSTMDVAPTLYELANVRPPHRVQGASLLSSAPRGWALCRLRHPDHPAQTALIQGGWKLVIGHGPPEQAVLFDLNADPEETNTLAEAPEHQKTLESLLDRLIDARVALEDRTEPRVASF